MASTPNLLAIPLEIRYQIYSYLLLNSSVVDVSNRRMADPLRNGVVCACSQTFSEMTEYYFANNTFLLSLLQSPETTPALLQRLGRVQHLQVEIGDLMLSPTREEFLLHSHTQRLYDWFLKILRQAKRGREGSLLRTLVAIDRCGTSIASE